MLDLLLTIAIALPTGLIGGMLARKVRVRIVVPPAVEQNVRRHEHDWHIEGKVKGRVRQYCTLCPGHKWLDEVNVSG